MELKTKKLLGVLVRACSPALFIVMLIIGTMIGASSCAEELSNPGKSVSDTITIIKDLYWTSERTGTALVAVKDSLAKSTAKFTQTSTLYDERENVHVTFSPTAYLNIVLSQKRIDVKKADELPTTLVNEYIQSQKPYKNQNTFGEDIVKVFEYEDGQIATVSYGYRYTAVVSGSDTLAVPHVEIDDVTYMRQTLNASENVTETEEPYNSTMEYKATYTIKGTSNNNTTATAMLKPWYEKVITSEPTIVESVNYEGRFINCPFDAYELVETVKTNKSEFTNTYRVDLSLEVTAPILREQPSLDSLFNETSKGKFLEKQFSQIKNETGFTVRTMTGTYVSSNTGKEAKTAVESTVSFTYQYPVKFESRYGTYTIPPLKMTFEEDGFEIKKISEDKESILYRSTNTVEATVGTCTLNLIDEVVNLRIQKAKPQDVVKVDSVYTIKGDGDDYIIDKTIIWSDGSKTNSTYEYKGRHSATATAFGNKVTTSLNWNENALERVSSSKETEEKKFSDVTKFTAVYTTSNWRSNATNGRENGSFAFTETSPVVTFVDGKTTKTFPERKYILTGMGADVAQNYTTMLVDGKNYKAYAYNYTTKVVWNGATQPNLVSNGNLLMLADEVGAPKYTYKQTWNGNTTTVTVTKTIPHSQAQDEVQDFTKTFTIGLSGLTDGAVYASNTAFSATGTNNETNSTVRDGNWTVKTYKRNYAYKVSNGTVTRDNLQATATDAEITFNDGSFNHTFNVRMNITKNERLGNVRTEGNYNVTPHILTLTGTTVDGKSISNSGTTNIYVAKSVEPEQPHLGKPKSFVVTATYDPTNKVTRRAFVFNWENGVTYAVCDYEQNLPKSSEFMYKKSTYTQYNSVGYDKNNSSHWQPARGTDDADAIRWYNSDGSLMSAIDKALSCKVVGWKNTKNGDYALIIEGYTYDINGYDITVKAPNGQTVTFNSHYE